MLLTLRDPLERSSQEILLRDPFERFSWGILLKGPHFMESCQGVKKVRISWNTGKRDVFSKTYQPNFSM